MKVVVVGDEGGCGDKEAGGGDEEAGGNRNEVGGGGKREDQ
jgi:hypothetical protein